MLFDSPLRSTPKISVIGSSRRRFPMADCSATWAADRASSIDATDHAGSFSRNNRPEIRLKSLAPATTADFYQMAKVLG